jgi:hypothetical protein
MKVTASEIAHGRWELDSPRAAAPCGCRFVCNPITHVIERPTYTCPKHRLPGVNLAPAP